MLLRLDKFYSNAKHTSVRFATKYHLVSIIILRMLLLIST